MSTPDTTRVSDTEREQVAEVLRGAVGRGQLQLPEFDERLRAAYAAVTRHDLAAVTADLPQPTPQPVTVAQPALVDRARVQQAEWRPWLGASLLMIGIWAVTSLAAGHALFFWPAIPVSIWAVSLVAAALGLKGAHHGCASARRS